MSTLQNIDQTSIVYIEHYLDVVENLPSSIARVMSRIHEIDIKRTKIASLIDASLQNYLRNPLSENEKNKLLNKFLSMMVQLQTLSDTKICLAQAIYDQIDIKARQLEVQGRSVPLSNAPSSSQTHNSTSSSNNAYSNSNSYANTNGTASISARGTLCNNSNSTNGNNSSLNTSLARSEAIISTEIKSSTSSTNKDNGNSKETSTQSSDNGKRTRRNIGNNLNATNSGNEDEEDEDEDSDDNDTTVTKNINSSNSYILNGNNGNKKDNSKEDSNGGSGDEVASTSTTTISSERPGKRGVAAKRNVKNARKSNENKRRKSSYNYNDDSPNAIYNSIDPDEPTYCLCEQVSYGEMICCDNNTCKIEWFHFSCVGLNSIPKGRWYCPDCRGDRSNIQKKSTTQ